MSLRVALALVAFCAAATPLAAAEAPGDARQAGLRGPETAHAVDAPRRLSVRREPGQAADRSEAAATDADLVLAPGFFAPLPPTLADPPPEAPAHDRQGRPIQSSSPDDAPQV